MVQVTPHLSYHPFYLGQYLPKQGTFQCPGGHLEYGESFAETAAREVLEETGLEVGNIKFLTATNDVFGEGKHYVTIFVTCTITGENKVPQVSFTLPYGTMCS
jgi:ADP-ribose pyrophosphatase YjhB (NUDIX family)